MIADILLYFLLSTFIQMITMGLSKDNNRLTRADIFFSTSAQTRVSNKWTCLVEIGDTLPYE